MAGRKREGGGGRGEGERKGVREGGSKERREAGRKGGMERVKE